MADSMKPRPFENYRAAITDPDYFRGRNELLKSIVDSPVGLRILIGGRRLGKTSLLHAVEWSLLHPSSGTLNRVFPVYINLRKEQPVSLENFFYILIRRLREGWLRWEKSSGANLRQRYMMFLSQIAGAEAKLGPFLKLKVINPDFERRLPKDDFEVALWKIVMDVRSKNRYGICMLFDEGDYFVTKAWADDAFSYIRGLKDSSDPLSPFIGLVLSGFRGVRDYKQRIGSALYNIGSTVFLDPLVESESRGLIQCRCELENKSLAPEDVAVALDLAGGHPYLIQQAVTALLDRSSKATITSVRKKLLKEHREDFSTWWNSNDKADGWGQQERTVYQWLVKKKSASISAVADAANLAEFEALDALECLMATGVVAKLDEETFLLGSQLFAEWVLNRRSINKPTVP